MVCPDGGTRANGGCEFERKLCVTCRTSGSSVYIRTQSNGYPNHCFATPNDRGQKASEAIIDYESKWLSATTDYSGDSLDQTDVNELICNIMRSLNANIPSSCDFSMVSGSNAMGTGWGIAVSGAQIYNGMSAEGVDPFYPIVYDNGNNVDEASQLTAEKVDKCLIHP